MSTIEFYVYECETCGEEEVLSSESVAPPEVHLFETELVYCPNCESDERMEFLGLEGLAGESFVMDFESEERYCPTCDGACER